MKIRIALTVDLDPQKWADYNGQLVDAEGHFTAAGVREDVRSHVLNAIQCSSLIEEADGQVALLLP